MGVAGKFWDLLKPYARNEGVDFLRNKRVAVDLSFWIVQHEAAIRHRAPRLRGPHLRTTFFRTVALFSKMGAFPVFVVDGEPSPLKAQARMERFFCNSGVDPSALLESAEGEEAPVKQRNKAFTRCVQECVDTTITSCNSSTSDYKNSEPNNVGDPPDGLQRNRKQDAEENFLDDGMRYGGGFI